MTNVGGTGLTFDANGNMLTDEGERNFTYDAWNRLAIGGPEDSNDYRYDALGRRITSSFNGDAPFRFFYSNQWQVIEEQFGDEGDDDPIVAQYVWSRVYVDAMVLRDRNADGNLGTGDLGIEDSGLEQRLYVAHDANFNVTALIDTSGDVMERFRYDPYGTVTFLDPNWSVDAGGSDFAWIYLDQGGRFDSVTGLYHRRIRDVSASLGRPIQADPIGYPDGMNRYQWEMSNPAASLDPFGLTIAIVHPVKPTWNGDDEVWERDVSYYERVRQALQAIVGDCAEITLTYHYTQPQWGWDSGAFLDGLISGGLYKASRITSATIGYANENPNCKCDDCWKLLKKALDDANLNVAVKPSFIKPQVDWGPGGGIIEVFDQDYPALSWEVDPTTGNIVAMPAPFAVVLWHELMHIMLQMPDNTASPDPIIVAENMGRNCMRKSGSWPGMWDRHTTYLPIRPTTGVGEIWRR